MAQRPLAQGSMPQGPAPRAPRRHEPGTLLVEHHPLAVPSTPGHLDTANARYVLDLLDRATDGASAGEFSAVVTAPVHKPRSPTPASPSQVTPNISQRVHAPRCP